MKGKQLFILGLAVLVLALMLGACSTEEESTELNLLCVPQEEWCQGMKEEFEDEFGITVNYVRMSTGEALARLEAERDNPQFDIMWAARLTPIFPVRARICSFLTSRPT
jgi:iron(III) transport system substrate-binding protein